MIVTKRITMRKFGLAVLLLCVLFVSVAVYSESKTRLKNLAENVRAHKQDGQSNDSHKLELTSVEDTPKSTRHIRHCIEKNICLINSGDQYYNYKKTDMFNQILRSPTDYKKSVIHDKPVVPKLVHFILFLGKKKKNYFRFHYLIAILAAQRFVKPTRIYLWCDKSPEGPYFEEIKAKVSELFLVHRLQPTHIYGRQIKVVEHAADVMRLEILLEYGGIYFDLDSIAVKSFDPLLKFDLTMGYEMPPYTLSNGIIVARPRADFLKIWYTTYKTFNDSVWAEHSVEMPARLEKKFPNLIHTEQTSFVRPNSWELAFLYDEGKLYDWRSKNYVVHLYFRYYSFEYNPESIKYWNTTAGEVYRYIYYGDWRMRI